MKKRIYLAMLVACVALTATACSDRGAVVTDDTKAEKQAEGKKAEAGSTRLVSVDNVDKYITIGEYKGLILDNTVDAITDDDVQSQIDQELQDKAEPVSEGAKEGDLVTVNYTGTIDGQTFDGGTANNYDFVIGDGQMFTEFEDGVTGMKKGDTKEIQIDFPSDYGDSTLAGKTAVYKVTVQNVRRTAELTDEWVAKNTDYTTVDEYKEGVRSKLEADAKQSAQEVLKNTAWSTVLENSEVKEYPEEDVDKAVEAYKKLNENYVKEAGMEMSDFLKAQGMSEEDYEEDCQQYAESKVEQNLIVQGIMDAEGLSLDDDDIQTLKDELLSEYGYESFDQLVAYYGEQEVNESLALMRVERFIVDNATVNETSATEADVANEDADPESEDTGVDAAEDTTEDNASEEDSSDTAEESEETASEDDVANEG